MKTENIDILNQVKKEINFRNRTFTGVVRGTRSRYGFLCIDNHEDIFIKPQEMDKVFSGDTVEATVLNYNTSQASLIINKIIKSERKIFMGLFSEDETGAYVFPDDYGFNKKIRIPKSFKGRARNNQYVKIEIIEHPFKTRKPKAKIVEIVGDKNCWHIQADYNMSKFNVDSYVSDEIVRSCTAIANIHETDLISFGVKPKKKKKFKNKSKRKDLTKLDFFTIDGENTVDIDDAIYVQKLKNKWKILVAISDVSELIEENSDIDCDAYNRMSTVYLIGKTIPMLSSEVTDVLSLKPLKNRMVVIADMTINLDGTVEKFSFYEAVIESKFKFSYNEVDSFIEGGVSSPECLKGSASLNNLFELHLVLRKNRLIKNVLPLNRDDYRNILNYNRKIESVEKLSTTISHRMVEESMLIANQCAALFVAKNYESAIYKIQNGIQDDKIDSIYKFLSEYFIFKKEDLLSSAGFKFVMSLIEEHSESVYFKSVIKLFLKDSEYSSQPDYHFSMGFENYTYFTSPLRRYSDIIIHRMIKAKVNGFNYKIKKTGYVEHFKNKSIAIQNCVRETEKWMQVDYLRSLNKETIFSARITGFSYDFINVKLVDNGIEGVIKIREDLRKNVVETSNLKIKIDSRDYKILDYIDVVFDDGICENGYLNFKIN